MKPQEQRAADADEVTELLGEPAALAFDGPPPSIDELVADDDVERLLELGAAYRVGAPHVERDLFKALECFEAASRLGSAEAEYLVGVAYFDGKGIAADQAEGAKRLRSSAQRGSLRAKVYVANLYEMGVYYQADREKADVWYRNVARAAGVEAEPGTDEHALEMAEIGCVRHCLELVADDALSAKDRAFFLKKAKAMGYHHRLAAIKRESRTPPELAQAVEAPAQAAAAQPVEPAAADAPEAQPSTQPEAPAQNEPEDEHTEPLLGEQWTWGHGLLAFVAAAFFVSSATLAGWLAMEGSRALAAAGRPLPHVGGAHEAVLWAIVVALGVLPATAAYRARVVAIAAVVGGAAGVGAHYLWDAQHLLWDRLSQSAAGGLGAFLVVLLFLGVLGGTRARVAPKTKRTKGSRP